MSKTTRFLHWIYITWFFVAPIFSVLYFTLSSETSPLFTDSEKGFLASSFFLVGLLHLFLGILWVGTLPSTLKGTLLTITWPFLWMGLQRLFIPFSLMTYVAGIGLVYMMSLAVWFTVFIFEAVREDPKSWWAGVLQLLFIIPALGATFIFGKFLLLHQILPLTHGKTWAVYLMGAAFIWSVLQPTWHHLFKRSDSTAQ